jgi:hypothetical protein
MRMGIQTEASLDTADIACPLSKSLPQNYEQPSYLCLVHSRTLVYPQNV